MFKKIILLFLLFIAAFPSFASHIIGGEYTYTYLGNNKYRIVFYLYRDCINGNQGALENDQPSSIRIINLDKPNDMVTMAPLVAA